MTACGCTPSQLSWCSLVAKWLLLLSIIEVSPFRQSKQINFVCQFPNLWCSLPHFAPSLHRSKMIHCRSMIRTNWYWLCFETESHTPFPLLLQNETVKQFCFHQYELIPTRWELPYYMLSVLRENDNQPMALRCFSFWSPLWKPVRVFESFNK